MARQLVILPTAVAVEQYCIRTGRKRGGGVVFGHEAISRGQLIRQAHAALFPGERMLSDAEATALTARACMSWFQTRPNTAFSGIADRPGFWRAARKFLGECRSGRLDPEDLRRLMPLAGIPGGRAESICGIYETEEQLFTETDCTELTRAEAGLAQALKDRFDDVPFLADCDEIAVRGLLDIRPALFDLILELARHRPVRLALPLPNDHPRSILWLVWAYRKFEGLGEHHPSGLTIEPQGLTEHAALAAVADRMFLPAAAIRNRGDKPFDARKLPLKILAAPTPQDEMLETARQAISLANGGAPERVAILFRNASDAADCVHAFRKFGVETEPEAPDPFAPVLALYELAENGFTRDDVTGFLARPPWRVDPALLHPETPAIFKRANVLKGGPADWRRRLESFARAERDKQARGRIEKLARAVEREIKDISRIANDETPERAIVTLTRLFDRKRADPGETVRARLAAIARVWRGWKQPLAPRTIRHLIETVAAPASAAMDQRPAGTRLLSVHDLPEMEIDHLFVTGMTAGSFPAEPVQEVLLKDHERLALSRAFVQSLPESRRHLAAAHRPFDTSREERLRENFLFFLCAAQARSSLTLSHSLHDSQGRPQVASSYLDEIDKLFADPAALREPAPTGVRTRFEREREAISALFRGKPVPAGADPDRLMRIGERAMSEQRRTLFYLERDRARRAAAANAYTGRLSERAPVSIKPELGVVALEDFAVCGFKGFARHVLGIREVETPVEGFSPKEFGTFLHTVLESLWRDMIEARPKRMDDRLALVDRAAGRLAEIIDSASKPFEHAGASGPIWKAQKQFVMLALEHALRMERRDVERGYWPAEVESEVKLTLERDRNPIALSGRIDRIDLNDGKKTVRIVDYKTSSVSSLKTKRQKLGETELQMAAYAMAAAEKFTCDAIELIYLSIKHGVDQLPVKSGDAGEMARLFDPAPLMETIDRRIFDVTPVDPAACGFCPLRAACRVRPVLEKADED